MSCAGPRPSITKASTEQSSCWRITLPHLDAAKCDAALTAHRDTLIAEWKHDRGSAGEHPCDCAPSVPGTLEAFFRLVETGWDTAAAGGPTELISVSASHRP